MMLNWFFSLWQNRVEFRLLVNQHPVLGTFLFVGLQAFQVIVAPLPGEITGFLAGFLFGAIKGFLLSIIGILIGSTTAFFIAKGCKKKWIKKYESSKYYLRVKNIFKKHGITGAFILYLIPGFPKDILNYLLGFMPIKFKSFIFICILGRIPATLALTLEGDVVYSGSSLKILLSIFSFVIVILGFLFIRKKLYLWLEGDPTT